MAIAQLSIDIEARLANFERDMSKMAKSSEDSANRIKQTWSNVGTVVGAALGSIIAAGAIEKFRGLVDSLDAISKSAQQVGLTTEEFTALTYAAGMAGVEVDEMTTGLGKLSVKMQEAASGSKEAVDLFKDMGINVKDASGNLKGSDVVLAEVAEKFSQFRDGAAKTALAIDLFGKSGAKMIPLLNGGASGLKSMADEAGMLGGIIDSKLAKQAEEFNDNLERLNIAAGAAGRSLASDLLPWLNQVAESFVIAAKNSEGFFEILNKKIPGLQNVNVSKELKDAKRQLDELNVARNGALNEGRPTDALEKKIEAVKRTISYYKELQIQEAIAGGANYGNEGRGLAIDDKKDIVRSPSGATGKSQKSAKEAKSSFTDYDAMLTERIASALEKTDIAKAAELQATLAKLDELAAAGLDPALIKAVRDDLTGASKLAADEIERLNRLLSETESSKLEETRDDMLLLTQALTLGRIAEEKYLEAVSARLEGTAKKSADASNEIDEFARKAAGNIQSALADFLFDPFSEGTDKMAAKFGQMLQRMAAEAAAARIAKALFGDIAGGATSGSAAGADIGLIGKGINAAGSWLGSINWSSLFGFADGGIMTSAGPLPLNKYANGGVANSPQFAVFGEGRMPEAFVPLPDGRNIPVKMSGRGSGGMVINQTINAGQGADKAEIRRSAAAGARAALGAMSGAQRYA